MLLKWDILFQELKTLEKAKWETGEDPMVFITKLGGFEECTPLRQQLEANAEHGNQVVEWGQLLKDYGVERVKIVRSSTTYYNLPE